MLVLTFKGGDNQQGVVAQVSEPGQEPDMAADEAEDMRLCGPQLQDRNGAWIACIPVLP